MLAIGSVAPRNNEFFVLIIEINIKYLEQMNRVYLYRSICFWFSCIFDAQVII